jgi:recombination protein RecT
MSQTAAPTQSQTQALAKTGAAAPAKKPATIKEHLESEPFKLAVARALPKHITAERFIRVGLTAMMKTPKLAECDQHSFFNAMLSLSQLGLEPDGRNAHLIPFKNNKRGGIYEVQLIIDYKGLVDLVMRSGLVSYIHADVVCENDEFEYDRGQIKKHVINLRKARGAAYAAYALCRFKDNTEKCEIMTIDEIEAVRARSRAKDSGPWNTDYKEMCKKTVFRRLSKWLPVSSEFRDALDKDFDTLEEARFQNAKPVSSANASIEFDMKQLGEGEPETELFDPKADLAALRKSLTEINVSEEVLIKWLAAAKHVTTPLANLDEMGECAPSRLNAIVTDWAKHKEQIVAFAAKK